MSVDSLVKIFSHSVGCLFVLSRVSFIVQKLLSLIRSYLFIFVFIVNLFAISWAAPAAYGVSNQSCSPRPTPEP